MPAPGVRQRVHAVVGEQDDQPVVLPGRDLLPGRPAIGRVHLGEPVFQPPGLLPVQAPVGPAGQAVGVQRDEPRGWCVMDVVGGSVAEIFVGKAVPGWARARPEMRGHELAAGDRPAVGIGGHVAGRTSHERLRAHREQLEGLVAVEPVGQPHRLPVTGQRGDQARGPRAHALVEGFVVAEAGQPRHLQAARGELAQGRLEQARVMREAQLAAEEVGPVRPVTVGLPEDVIRPVHGLHPGVAGTAGVGRDPAAVEQGQERLDLVPLRVVDRVPGGYGERGRLARGRPAQRVHRAQRGVHRVRGERLLRALHRHYSRVPGVGEVAVEELEPGRRLDVGQLQVGDVDEAEEGAGAWWAWRLDARRPGRPAAGAARLR